MKVTVCAAMVEIWLHDIEVEGDSEREILKNAKYELEMRLDQALLGTGLTVRDKNTEYTVY